MTAPSLSIPGGTLAVAWQHLRAIAAPRPVAGLAAVAGVAVLSQIVNGGGRVTLDPALPLVITAVAVGVFGGLRAAWLAGALAVAYGVFFYAQPASLNVPGNGLRVIVFVAGTLSAAALAGWLRDRLDRLAGGSGSLRGMLGRGRAFSDALTEARPDTLAATIASRAALMAEADMAVVTVVDLRTGRHVVRAVHGTSNGALGVEVLPGVGLAGQAIRDQRAVVVGAPFEQAHGPLEMLRERIVGLLLSRPAEHRPAPPRVSPAIALPLRHAGSVIATLTLGRARGARPFTDDEQRVLELVAPQVALAVANTLLRAQLREASLRDALTGLYNRSYLDAALDQMLALRRRTAADKRPPLSLILFDLDDFRQLNELHGQPVGDQVLRAVAVLLRQRFRASDTIARVGCDGFVVVMDSADLKTAVEAAGLIRRQLREMSLNDERGAPLSLSISAGCATFRDDVARSEQIIRTVEAALDTARWSGPGAVVAI